jgi:glycosyltransferase involved in cell wall biosynthesis
MNGETTKRDELTICIIATTIGKSPREVTHSFIFDEAIKLSQRGLNIHVVTSKLEREFFAYGLKFHGIARMAELRALHFLMRNLTDYSFISLLRNPLRIYWESLYALSVSRVIEKYDVDLIHAHFAYPEGFVGVLAGEKIKRPLIVTIHGYDLLTEPSVGYGLRLHKHYDLIIRSVLKKADAIILSSKALYREASLILSSNEIGKIHLIPNGVDVNKFNPSIDGSEIKRLYKAEGKYIVFTARHHRPVYGIAYLIMAAKLVISKRKDVIFIIGGDGPLLNYHKELAGKLGIKDHIVFTGAIPRDIIPKYYAASDIVVVPSLQESWGLVATEAMACGKPVIASNVGGLPDQIIDGFNGFLVPPRSPKAIADKILYLLENPSEARRIGRNGRMLAEEKYDIEKRVDKIIEVYKKLLENNKLN